MRTANQNRKKTTDKIRKGNRKTSEEEEKERNTNSQKGKRGRCSFAS
jgi:hypothetical protein